MQQLRTIWRNSPFSWQGISARWRQLLSLLGIALVLFGAGYALRVRSSSEAGPSDSFIELANEQQRYLMTVEGSLQLEHLRALIRSRRDDEATRLFNGVSATLEASLRSEHWLELEPHLTKLGGLLGRGGPEAVQALDTLIALLRP